MAGTITYTLGDDAIGSVTLSTTGGTTPLQTLAGAAVNATWVAGQLIGHTGSDASNVANRVFTITVSGVTNSGAAYDMVLLQPVKHTTSGTEDNTAPFTVNVVVADADGSTGTSSFTVVIDDDTPIAVNDGSLATINEIISNLNLGPISTLTGDDLFGADGPGASAVTFSAGSLGGSVSLVSGNVLYTTTTNVTAAQGSLVETFIYTITDGDGDTATGTFSVTLTDTGVTNVTTSNNLLADEDNIPTIGNNNITGSGDDAQVLSGTINYTLGDDALASIALSVVATGITKLDGTAISTSWDAGTNTLTGYGTSPADVVFTITLSAIGATLNAANTAAYAINLLQPVKHSVSGTEDNTAPFTVNVLITDADGSTGTSSFTVAIDDDVPVAVNDGSLATINEIISNLNLGPIATLTGDDLFGADGPGASAVTFSAGSLGGSVSLVSGNVLYTTTTNVTAAQGSLVETFSYTIKDGDGDTATATFTVTLTDTGVTNVTTSNNLLADEDNIPTIGNNNITGSGDDAQVLSGTINYTLGDDALASIVLSVVATGITKLDGTAISTSWDAGTNTLTGYGTSPADVVFTITLSAIGATLNAANTAAYAINLLQPVKHSVSGTEDNTAPFTVSVLITDADGSTGTSSFTVAIDDDVPVAVNDGSLATINEIISNLNLGPIATLTGDDLFGADGPGASAVTFSAGSLGGSVSLVSGNVLYTTTTNVTAAQGSLVETFSYTITDGDGDTATGTFSVTLTDTGVTNVTTSNNLLADEDNIPTIGNNNITGSGDDAQVLSGTINYTLGDDALASIALSVVATGITKLDGTAISTSWDAGTNTLTGYGTSPADVVFTITLSAIGATLNAANTAAYAINLLQPVKHSVSGTEDNTAPFTVSVLITDADGSTGTSSFTVAIDDDLPLALSETPISVPENGPVSGTLNLLSNDTLGADGATLTHVQLPGSATFVSISGSPFIVAGVGTYTFSANGNWTFDPSVNASTSNQTGNFTYQITDGDGDTSTATQAVNITNVSSPLMLVGSNTGDQTGEGTDHTVPNPQGSVDGVLQGGDLADKIVGDPGAVDSDTRSNRKHRTRAGQFGQHDQRDRLR